MDPVTVQCSSACTVTLQLDVPPFNLSLEEGAAISGAILLVWVVGFGIRALIRALNVDGDSSTSTSSEN